MAGGLRFESLADMPSGMRQLAAKKIITASGKPEAVPVADQKQTQQKYHNEKTEVNGILFDSRKEARRYEQLLVALEFGWIRDLHLQQDFTLQEAYTTADGERIRAIRYKADFTYIVGMDPPDPMKVSWEDRETWAEEGPGALIIEDVKSKGTRTEKYKIKYKLMAEKGYHIREV